jgi:NADH-quinone oxidoreductase subunit G
MTSDYQLNTVDICPVGALTSTDFRFKSRVWFMKQTRSVCGSCSRGCNTTVGTRWNKVQRMVPAENQAVNKWWMCDAGRLNYKFVATDDRLGAPMVRKNGQLEEVTWDEALKAAAEGLKAAGEDLFALVSARLTNEELYLASTILDVLGTPHRDIKPRTWEQDDLLRTGDGNPNGKGAELLGIQPGTGGTGLDGFAAGLADGTFKGAFLCGEDLDDQPELLEKLKGLDFVLSIDFAETDTVTQAAHVVLPGVTFFEKEGSFTNVDGRVQRVQASVEAPGDARADWKILGALRERLEGVPASRSITLVSQALCASVPALAGCTLGKLGRHGVDLATDDDSDAEAAAVTSDADATGEGS